MKKVIETRDMEDGSTLIVIRVPEYEYVGVRPGSFVEVSETWLEREE